MASYNNIALLGTITNMNKELAPDGTPMRKFMLAVDNSYMDKTGKKVDRRVEIAVSLTEFFAARLEKQLEDGDEIIVEGELRSATNDKNGTKSTAHSIYGKSITFVHAPNPEGI